MLEIKRKRSHAIIMWLLSAAVTMGSLCWRLFLPVYYQNNPNVWHIWLKGAVAIFLFPLILAPAGIYRWLPRLLQHWKANKPWLLCVIIFIEVLLTYLFFGHILYLAKSLAVGVLVKGFQRSALGLLGLLTVLGGHQDVVKVLTHLFFSFRFFLGALCSG